MTKKKVAFIGLISVFFLIGCMKLPPKFVPTTASESGTLTVFHNSSKKVWRTNTWVVVDGDWFYGFTGNDYKRERISVGEHNLSVGVNAGMNNPDLKSYTIRIKKNVDTCIKVSPDIKGFYWVDTLGVNETTLNWKIVTPKECAEAISIRKKK